MELGVFAKTFRRRTVEEVFAASASYGLHVVQFNMACAGLPSLPSEIPAEVADRVRAAASTHAVRIAALSATFNMIHPLLEERERGFASLEILAEFAATLGIPVVTLCTGTCDSQDMWRDHPDNATGVAWREMVNGMQRAVAIADRWNVLLGIEPEPANVVCDAAAAQRLLGEIPSDRLRIIFDPANLVAGAPSEPPEQTLREAMRILGPRIALAHGKDLDERGIPCAPGGGVVPWRFVVDLLSEAGYAGPLILHGFEEADLPGAVSHLEVEAEPI